MNRVDKSIVVNHMVNMVNSVKMLIFSIFYNNVDVKTDSYLNISDNSYDEPTNIFCKFKECPHLVLVVNK